MPIKWATREKDNDKTEFKTRLYKSRILVFMFLGCAVNLGLRPFFLSNRQFSLPIQTTVEVQERSNGVARYELLQYVS